MASASSITNRVDLHEIQKGDKNYLQFDFIGHLDYPSAQSAIEAWRKFLKADGKVDLIYNCLAMTGFDTPARKLWQSTLAELKSHTGNIWIVSTNNFILAAAKTMGLLSGYDIRVVKSIESIKS